MLETRNQGAWHGRIELGFDRRADRTVLSRRRFQGPLMVQKPFYPEGDPCHVYLLHPPAGVVGGDVLEVIAAVETGAHALITTPASGKFYRSTGKLAQQIQRFTVAANGVLEWLPQDTILFDGCNALLESRVELAENARFIGWEISCLGRPASGEGFRAGCSRQTLELYRSGRPLMIERAKFQGDHPLLDARWGMSGYSVSGVMVATNADEKILRSVRSAVSADNEALTGMTLLDEVLVCCYLGRQGERARHWFEEIWRVIRPLLLSREASAPRIWRT